MSADIIRENIMKLEKSTLIAVIFVVSLVILSIISFVLSDFKFELQSIIAALYFAIWITLLAFLYVKILGPFINSKMEERANAKTKEQSSQKVTNNQRPSSRALLPLRERIQKYVAERRQEDGLPVPEPLKPSRTVVKTSDNGRSAAKRGTVGAATAGVATAGVATLSNNTDTLSGSKEELPGLPDNFDLRDSNGDVDNGEIDLPGLDDIDSSSIEVSDDNGEVESLPDLPNLDDDMDSDFGDESFDNDDSSDLIDEGSEQIIESDNYSIDNSALPDFEGPLEPDMEMSDLSFDDDMDISEEDDTVDEPLAESIEDGGDLPLPDSDDGELPDFDGSLDLNMSEDDLVNDDNEDLGDIDFSDVDPE